jgi:hypothetical protein
MGRSIHRPLQAGEHGATSSVYGAHPQNPRALPQVVAGAQEANV